MARSAGFPRFASSCGAPFRLAALRLNTGRMLALIQRGPLLLGRMRRHSGSAGRVGVKLPTDGRTWRSDSKRGGSKRGGSK
jgi:hypothetical protein